MMESENRYILALTTRSVLFIVFFSCSFSLTVSWKSLVTLIMFVVSIYIIPLKSKKAQLEPTDRKLKTREVLKELYPTQSEEIQEQNACEAIYKLVTYDPLSVPALENFQVIQQSLNCTFAKKAQVWGTPNWNASLSIGENVYRFLPMLLKFTIVCLSQRLDGFLIELPGDIYGASVQDFGDALREVLTAISDHDPAKIHCMNKSYIGKRGWVFEFNKCTFFITTFAPFYPESHPRYAFGAENCYILLQPELSFAFHDLPDDTVNTNWENPQTIRDKIRVAFREAGRPYYIPDSIYSPMAHEILRPVNDSDPLYEWWFKKEH